MTTPFALAQVSMDQRRSPPTAPTARQPSAAKTQRPKQPSDKKKERTEPVVAPTDVCTPVYCDDDLLVVNKSAGFPVVPAGAFHRRSVLIAVAEQGFGAVFPISLLDPEATGLVLLSRSEAAAKALRWNWRSNLCERQYIAVCQGDIVGARGRITLTIGAVKHGPLSQRHRVLPLEDGGRPAVTTWKLLARGRGMSRLLVTLKGGRCHQIRIHLAAIGFPIVGDRTYTAASTAMPLSALVEMPTKYRDATVLAPGQIALHCMKVTMPHPITNQPMVFEAPPPRVVIGLMPGAWIVDAA